MLKKLEPGKTVIGKVPGKVEGVYKDFVVYYGNVVDPVINGKMYHLPETDYMSLLKEFLQSKEGQIYQVPSVAEVRQAVKELINQEWLIKSAQEEKRQKLQSELDERENARRDAAQEEERKLRLKEIQAQEEANALKKIEIKTLKNKNKILLIISIVLAIINIAVLGLTIYLNIGDVSKIVKPDESVQNEVVQEISTNTLEQEILGRWNMTNNKPKITDSEQEYDVPEYLVFKEGGALETEKGDAWIYKVENNTIIIPYGIDEDQYDVEYKGDVVMLTNDLVSVEYMR